MEQITEIKLSHHAKKRMKERCGLNKKAAERLAIIAFTQGLTHAELRGRVKRYVDYLYLKEQRANAIKIYGNEIFLFRGNMLITVLDLPSRFTRSVQQLSKKRHSEQEKRMIDD